MKILHFVSSPAAGGAEIYVKDLAKALIDQGGKVFIGFLCHAIDIDRDAEFEDRFLAELSDMGVSYFFAGKSFKYRPVSGALHIRKYVKDNQIDIYHSHLKCGVLFGALLTIPRFYTHHSTIFTGGMFWFFLSNFLVDQYIGISETCANSLSRYTGKAVETIFNGVSLARLGEFAAVRHLRDKPIVCVAVGRIVPEKNYELLIAAIDKLPRSFRDSLLFQIAGEGSGPYADKIRGLAASGCICESIQFLGNQSDIPKLLSQASLFVMSSRSEGLPISLIEATMLGLPSVVTDVGGCSEVIGACNSGRVVPPGDPGELADAIQHILSNAEEYSIYSKNALERSVTFNVETSARSHLSLYGRHLKERSFQ